MGAAGYEGGGGGGYTGGMDLVGALIPSRNERRRCRSPAVRTGVWCGGGVAYGAWLGVAFGPS